MSARPRPDLDLNARAVAVVALKQTAQRLRQKFPTDPRIHEIADALARLAHDLEKGRAIMSTPELKQHLKEIEEGNLRDALWRSDDEMFDQIQSLCNIAISHLISSEQAAYRRDKPLLRVHLNHVREATKLVLKTYNMLPYGEAQINKLESPLLHPPEVRGAFTMTTDSPPDPITARAARQFRDERAQHERTHPAPKKQDAGGAKIEPPPFPPPKATDGDSAPAFSDEALALLFAERHADDLRFVAEWSEWLSWAETHWRSDNTLHAFDLARRIIREVAATCNKRKDAKIIASAKTVAGVERLSKSDRRLAATIEQWDVAADIFNTQMDQP